MEAAEFIENTQGCLKQVDELRQEKQAIGSPKVKAWKTEVEQILRSGGKNTIKVAAQFYESEIWCESDGYRSYSG